MYWLVFPMLRWSSLSSVWLVGGEQSLERCVFAARIVGWSPTQSAVTAAPCPVTPLLLALPWRLPRCSYEICPFLYTLFFPYCLLISWKTKSVCCVEQATLADFAPVTSPQIPALVIYCIKEIEQRGLHEVRWRCLPHTCPQFPSVLPGLISQLRSSGSGRSVQSLWQRTLGERAKGEVSERKNFTFTSQNRGYQCHNGCPQGFLQETPRATAHLPAQQSLYRSSWWGLMTHNIAVYGVFILGLINTSLFFFFFFKEVLDDGNSLAMIYQAISELPRPNRDTLACLMIHLQK